jgi:hypothetical protein
MKGTLIDGQDMVLRLRSQNETEFFKLILIASHFIYARVDNLFLHKLQNLWSDENIRNKGKAGSLYSHPRWWINLILCQLFRSFLNYAEVTVGNLMQIFDKNRIHEPFPQITLSADRLIYIRLIVLEGHSNNSVSLNIQVVNIKFLKRQIVRIRINYGQHTHFFFWQRNAGVHFYLTWVCFHSGP